MEDFKKLVQRCMGKNRKTLENYTIFNSSADHATTLINGLLEVAARDGQAIRIFSGSFTPAVYDGLVESLKKAITAKVQISLISELAPEPNNTFINTARTAGVSIKIMGKKIGFPHFVLVGNQSYRIESDDALRTAKGNFNDAVTGGAILALYNNLDSLPIITATP